MKNGRYSLELIRQTQEFTVSISSAGYFKEADYCGIVSGRKRNKFVDTGLTPISASKVSAPIIRECPFNVECRVVREEIELSEWVAIFGETVETHVDEDKVDTSNGRIDIGKVDPLVYCATIREYWSLAAKIGKGFSAGRDTPDGIGIDGE